MTYTWTFLKHSAWRMFFFFLSVTLFCGTGFSEAAAAEPEEIAKLELTGDWSVRGTYGGRTQEFAIEPAKLTSVTDERVKALPVLILPGLRGGKLGRWRAFGHRNVRCVTRICPGRCG